VTWRDVGFNCKLLQCILVHLEKKNVQLTKTLYELSKYHEQSRNTDQYVDNTGFKLVTIIGIVRFRRNNFTKRLRDVEARLQRQIGVSFHHFSTQPFGVASRPVTSRRDLLYQIIILRITT